MQLTLKADGRKNLAEQLAAASYPLDLRCRRQRHLRPLPGCASVRESGRRTADPCPSPPKSTPAGPA